MAKLTDYSSYADAQRCFTMEGLWELFDGNERALNIAHECIDRYAGDPHRIAVRIAHADGTDEALTFRALSEASSRFAHELRGRGVAPGDRVAIMLEPSFAFYATLFGTIKCGAVAVPLFTAFGPDGVRLRIDDCAPRLLVTNEEKAADLAGSLKLETVIADAEFIAALERYPTTFTATTRADDLAVFQYTSGTTRELPAAIRHKHRAIVLVMIAGLYGTGIRPGDRYFCPSSPAWGHGLWHGTLAPLALGLETGVYAGKFDPVRLLRALHEYGTTNVSAAATHYRMMMLSGAAPKYTYAIRKQTYTGEAIDSESLEFAQRTFGAPIGSIYGTTEVGVCLVCYPGAHDLPMKPGSLGKPVPGVRVEVQDAAGNPCPPDVIGEIKVWRSGAWFPTKDRGYVDADGYFYHAGRADDVIISAGWTMSANEIESAMLKHPAVQGAAVIAVPDAMRGQIAKAFVISNRPGDEALAVEIQEFVRAHLSRHEFPRALVFVEELPKTPAGKINRKALRDREAAAAKLVSKGN
ncbi:acetate--CoA ligase [bacterium]|nr:MAG: acetate--CoA ligase [bacterium]